jgi:Ca2+-binding EF-hand superfamily protein
MNRSIVIAAGAGFAIVAAAAGIAVAQPAAAPEGPRADRDVTRQEVIQRVDERFAQMDENRDGRVTSEERRSAAQRRRAEMADRMFDRIDADRDGSISREEMRERRMHRGGRRGMRMAGSGGPGMDGRRGDGMEGRRGGGAREFTREEMRERALARFDRVDANRDGTLTVEERRQARDARRERMRTRREES